MWNLFKVNCKDTWTTSMTSLLSILNRYHALLWFFYFSLFEKVNNGRYNPTIIKVWNHAKVLFHYSHRNIRLGLEGGSRYHLDLGLHHWYFFLSNNGYLWIILNNKLFLKSNFPWEIFYQRSEPCWSVISRTLLCNFIEMTLRHGHRKIIKVFLAILQHYAWKG